MIALSMIAAVTGETNSLDALIAALILLFILSTITEKVTELVRMYPGQFRIVGTLFCLFFYYQVFYGFYTEPPLGKAIAIALLLINTLLLLTIIANTASKENRFFNFLTKNLTIFENVNKAKTNISPDAKEREVTALSFFLGLVVSLLFNVNLFDIFKAATDPAAKPISPFLPDSLFKLNPEFFAIDPVKLIGIVLTAFFLSFGAKFFHDLLDTLLQIKNLRRKANDRADFEFSNIEEVDKFLAAKDNDLFNEFLETQLNKPGVFFESNLDTLSVTVHLSDPAIVIPDKLFYKNSLGKVKEVNVIKKQSRGIKTLSIPLFPSAEIANQKPFNQQRGTFCYPVRSVESGDVFLLTCYHVIWNKHDWSAFDPATNVLIVHPSNGKNIIGRVTKAIKNNVIDAALIKPENVSLVGVIDGIGKVDKDRALNPGDKNMQVKITGSVSGKRSGFISELKKTVFIKYPNSQDLVLSDLMVIKTNDGRAFSKGGDSGSLVVDKFGFAIGMIVAGDEDEISLAIPFSNLKDTLKIEIFNPA